MKLLRFNVCNSSPLHACKSELLHLLPIHKYAACVAIEHLLVFFFFLIIVAINETI